MGTSCWIKEVASAFLRRFLMAAMATDLDWVVVNVASPRIGSALRRYVGGHPVVHTSQRDEKVTVLSLYLLGLLHTVDHTKRST